MSRARSLRSRIAALGAASVVAATGAVIGTSIGVGQAAADDCKPNMVLGIPGTNQGVAHNHDARTDADRYGGQVATVLEALDYAGVDFEASPVIYDADGLDNLGAYDAKYHYNESVYKESKDQGFEFAYAVVKDWAESCPDSKISLVGYSQGAHIAGDLVNSIAGDNPDIKQEQLGYVVLISDPAYNSTSPNTYEFRYDPSIGPGGPGFNYERDVIVADPEHWDINGALGRRDAFPNDINLVSLCIYGDPVCDYQNPVKAGVSNWRHTKLYTEARYDNAHNLAEWAGQQMAEKLK